MPASRTVFSVILSILFIGACVGPALAVEKEEKEKAPPKVGEKVEDFKLKSHRGEEIALSEALEEGPVVLLVLRGYPGYQCPLCTRQVADFRRRTQGFVAKDAQIFMVYPGPAEELEERGKEFLKDAKLPKPLHLLLDPDYKFTNLYSLRWDKPRETAYPSTFLIGQDGKVKFAKVSKTHGDRTTAKEVLAAMEKESP